MTAYESGEVYPVAPPNQIEAAISEQFGDPALWSREEPVRLRVGTMAGLQRVAYFNDRYYAGGRPAEHWATLLYGSRLVEGTDPYEVSEVGFETTSLRTMADIHARLATTVLAGEHARPSVLVDPPVVVLDPTRDRANHIFWLKKIIRGVWPIMATGQKSDGEKVYFPHDYSDFHNAISLLLPKETQDLITQVAQHELTWLQRHIAGKVPRGIALPGDTEMSPFGVGPRDRGFYFDGMYVIDEVTDAGEYMDLLQYLLHGNGATPEVRLAAIEAYIQEGGRARNNPIGKAAIGLRIMRMQTGSMVNFISRHRDGRNTTPEAVDVECEKFEKGVVRVARKILGEYDFASESRTRRHRLTRATAAVGRLLRLA